jgi:amino acid adenylation domain-containing protein
VDGGERTSYPVSMSVDDGGVGFALTAQVASATVDPARLCAFMTAALEALVTALGEAPHTPLCGLNLLPPAERTQLLVAWNATAAAVSDSTVHALIEAQAARTPDAPAVVFDDQVLSYATINARANQLAHALIAAGVGPDVRVALALERSPTLIVALLATLKAGGAYVPLDPAYPAARLAFMLSDAGAQVVLTHEALRARLPKTPVRTLCLDTEADVLATLPTHNPARPVDLAQLAYVIYTSGSTGTPKGVAMPHAPLSNLIGWQLASTAPGARTLHYASVGFDVSFQEVAATLASGGCLVLIDDEARHDGLALMRFLEANAVEQLFLPYAALAALSETASHAGVSLGALRAVFTAGEQLKITPAIVQMFQACGARLCNQYGPTETHVVTAFELGGDATHWPELPPIGRAIANMRLYVLDAYGQPTPVGVPGELYIGGPGLARGYLGRPDLTAERYVPDPFSAEPGARLYAAGDRVRYRADGQLEFLGRRDHQVKVRGVRVEPGEIEAALLAHPGVREAVVLARTETGDARLVAYVVPRTGAAPDDVGEPDSPSLTATSLRAHLANTLPDALVPAAYVVLPELPRARNGKVDRAVLPAP